MLDLLQNTLAEEQQSKRDAKMVKKYKMVKFFGMLSWPRSTPEIQNSKIVLVIFNQLLCCREKKTVASTTSIN